MADLSHEPHVLESLPAYATGSLEAGERRKVEEHLSGCWICRTEASAFEAAAGELSLAVPQEEPAGSLKDRLMERVDRASAGRAKVHRAVRRAAPPPSFRARLLPAWGLVSLFLIVALAASSLLLWQRVVQLESATTPGGMRAVSLSPTGSAPRAAGFVVISADGDDGALVVDGLPPLGESQQYQLWLVRDGQQTSGAVFSTDEKSYGGTRIRAPRSLLDYSAVNITIEPAGGSLQPTGDPVLWGELQRR